MDFLQQLVLVISVLPCTVKPQNNGHSGRQAIVHWKEVVLFKITCVQRS